MTFRLSRFGAVAAGAGLLIYSFLVIRHAYYSVWGSDPTGYVNVARSLIEGRIAQPAPALDELKLPDEFIYPWRYAATDRVSRPVSMNPKIMSGRLVISGTRIPVNVILGRKRSGAKVAEIAKDYGLDSDTVQKALAHIDVRQKAA